MSEEIKRICGWCIKGCNIVQCDIRMQKSTYFLIKGSVYLKNGEPLAHAGIIVYQISGIEEIRQYVGMTFTLEDGSYGITVKKGYTYEVKCYP